MTLQQSGFGQQIIDVYTNGHKAGSMTTGGEHGIIDKNISINRYSSLRKLSLEIKTGTHTPYKTDIEVINEKDSILMDIAESKSRTNYYNIDVKKLRSLLKSFHDINVYLNQEPKNKMMRIRSNNIQILKLHFQ